MPGRGDVFRVVAVSCGGVYGFRGGGGVYGFRGGCVVLYTESGLTVW